MKIPPIHKSRNQGGADIPVRVTVPAILLLALVFVIPVPGVCAQMYHAEILGSTPPAPPTTPPDTPIITTHDICRVTLRGSYDGNGNCQILLGDSEVSPIGGNIDGLAFIYSNYDYQLIISADQMNSITLNIQAPAGYYVWLDDTPRKRIQILNDMSDHDSHIVYDVYTLQLRTDGGGAAGTGGSVKLGEELAWGVNLGRLHNGSLAGAIVMRAELAPSQINRGSIAARGVDQQVFMVYDDKSWLRQVIAPEVFVDINDLHAGSLIYGFTADFYPLEAMGAADPVSGIRAIKSGSNYYVRHTVIWDSMDGLLVTTGYSASSGLTTSITQQGGTWMKNIGDGLIVETVESGTIENERWEITTTKDGTDNETPDGGYDGKVARKTKRIYKDYSWSDLMPSLASDQGTLSDVIIDPDGAALTTHYEYYTDAELKGSYAQIKSIAYSDGSWAKYEYYEEGETGYGQIKREYHPWLDGATLATVTASNCHVVEYTYAADWDGVERLPASRIEKINGVTVAKQEFTHTFSGSASIYYDYRNPDTDEPELARLWEQETRTWPDGDQNATPLVSKITRYKPDSEGTLGIFDGLPYSVTQSDGTKTVYVHFPGTVSHEIAFHGMAASAPGLIHYTPWSDDDYDFEGRDVDSLYLKPNYSTKTVRTKQNGRIMREETYIYAGAEGFSLIVSKQYTYNESGRLIRVDSGNGLPYEATWVDGFKTSETGADGIKYTYSPDPVMRVSRAVKTGVPAATIGGVAVAAQPYMVIDYTYNAAGNITSRTTGDDNGLALKETFEYDLAGRLTRKTAPGGDTTTIAYGTRTQTTTYPGGATHVVQSFLDGQAKSETGTAIVGMFYDYGVTSDGFRWSETATGSTTSNAKTRSTYDWTGRLRSTVTPAINGTSGAGVNTTTHAYDALGRLVRTETPGLAPTLYEYDPATGALSAQGLLCGSGTARATLDPSLGDRMIRFENQFVSDYYQDESESEYKIWIQEQKSCYFAGSGTIPLFRSHTRVRLGEVASEVETFDAHGNKTVQTTSIDRSNRVTTTRTTVPGSNIQAVSHAHNGLLVYSRDALGQSVTYDYDSLGRAIRTRRPGKTAVETVYDPVSGRVRQTQFADEASTLITAYEYDSAGRISKTTNTDGATTHFTYDIRGQLLSRHGTGVIPVAYKYDALGRLIEQTTWRGDVTDTLPSAYSSHKNTTTFEYLGDFALVTKATNALGKTTDYAYDTLGRVTALQRSRKLADNTTPVTVSYAYDPATGELTGKSYNDGATPALTYEYNAYGQLDSVTDATGTRTFDYADDGTGRLLSETLPAHYRDPVSATSLRRLAYDYDSGAAHAAGSAYAPLAGRLKTASLVDSAGTVEASAAYWFLGNTATGRIEVADATATDGLRAFQYSWMPQQPALLQQSVEMQTGLARAVAYADPLWDSPTRVATGFSGTPVPEPLAAYDMTYDTLGRPVTLQQSGAIFSGYGEPIHHKYAYNLRGQLTSARSHMGAAGQDNRPMPGRQYTFDFDNAGNRTAATNDDSLSQTETVNALGQITQKENKSIHVSGVANEGTAVAVKTDEGVTAVRAGAANGRFWSIELSLNAVTDIKAAKSEVNIYLGKPAAATGQDNIIKTIPQTLVMLPKKEAFTYDDDGNLLSDGQWDYAYDAENRLVSMWTKSAVESILLATPGGEQPLIISFTYDYANRRASKRVQEKIDGQWRERYHHCYVYDGSSLVAEIDASTREVLRTFAWGATGELLMIHDRTDPASPQTYLPVRNVSGSVTAMVRAADSVAVATYEYDPNGNLLRAQGEYARSNPFTFGGWMDWETGLVNSGSVYYSSRLGRFINTGPSGSGDGVSACFGVDLVISYLPLRHYARPSARRNAVTATWQSVDPAELEAYQAAWAAYEAAWAAYDAWFYQYMEDLGNQSSDEPPEDNLAEEFIADSQHFHYISVNGSFDLGLSNDYLIGVENRAGGSYAEYYSDGSLMMVNTLGSTLSIENNGAITVSFSDLQLGIMTLESIIGTLAPNNADANGAVGGLRNRDGLDLSKWSKVGTLHVNNLDVYTEAKKAIIGKAPDAKKYFEQLESNKDGVVLNVNTKEVNNFIRDSLIINWDPLSAFISKNYERQPGIIGLIHEVGHFYNYVTDTAAYMDRLKIGDCNYTDAEEKLVITGIEWTVCKAFGYDLRTTHSSLARTRTNSMYSFDTK